jgi:branched-chain amino acid transport system substrate-binding protein
MQNTTSFLPRIVVAVFLIATMIAAAWYAYPLLTQQDPVTITLHYSAPLSLDSTSISVNSVKLALEKHHYTAGGMKINLAIHDDGDKTGAWTDAGERKAALAAASDPSTVAFIGPLNSGAAKISMPILNKLGIVQISPSATWPGLTKTGFLPGEPGIFYPSGIPHFVRVAATDDLQGPAGAQWAHQLGFKSVYVINDKDPYGVGIADLFQHEAGRIGISILGSESVSPDPKVYQPVAERILAAKPDLVYYGGLTADGGPELLKYIHEKGSTAAFMGPDGIFEQEFVTRAGTSSEGAYITAIGAPPEEIKTPTAEAFIQTYKDKFHSSPDVFGALAYDATNALLDAIDRVKTNDRSTILQEVKNIRKQPGVFATWGFDESGDTSLTLMSGSVIKNGTFLFEKVLSK